MSIVRIPNEIIVSIVDYLDDRSILNFSGTCKKFFRITREEIKMRERLEVYLPQKLEFYPLRVNKLIVNVYSEKDLELVSKFANKVAKIELNIKSVIFVNNNFDNLDKVTKLSLDHDTEFNREFVDNLQLNFPNINELYTECNIEFHSLMIFNNLKKIKFKNVQIFRFNIKYLPVQLEEFYLIYSQIDNLEIKGEIFENLKILHIFTIGINIQLIVDCFPNLIELKIHTEDYINLNLSQFLKLETLEYYTFTYSNTFMFPPNVKTLIVEEQILNVFNIPSTVEKLIFKYDPEDFEICKDRINRNVKMICNSINKIDQLYLLLEDLVDFPNLECASTMFMLNDVEIELFDNLKHRINKLLIGIDRNLDFSLLEHLVSNNYSINLVQQETLDECVLGQTFDVDKRINKNLFDPIKNFVEILELCNFKYVFEEIQECKFANLYSLLVENTIVEKILMCEFPVLEKLNVRYSRNWLEIYNNFPELKITNPELFPNLKSITAMNLETFIVDGIGSLEELDLEGINLYCSITNLQKLSILNLYQINCEVNIGVLPISKLKIRNSLFKQKKSIAFLDINEFTNLQKLSIENSHIRIPEIIKLPKLRKLHLELKKSIKIPNKIKFENLNNLTEVIMTAIYFDYENFISNVKNIKELVLFNCAQIDKSLPNTLSMKSLNGSNIFESEAFEAFEAFRRFTSVNE